MIDIENTTSDYSADYNYSDSSPCSTDATLTLGSGFQPTLLSLVFLLGLTGNSVVLWVLVRFIRLKSLTDVCLLNLAISDLLVALSLPLWVYRATGQGFVGDGLCKATAGIYRMGLYSGILFVSLMSVDRYLAIVHAVAAMRARTLRYGVIASMAVWTISICASLPEIIFTIVLEDDGLDNCHQIYPLGSEMTYKLLRNFGENAVVLFISLPIMFFCYSRILAVLLRSRNSNRHRAMRLVFAIVSVFTFSWVPYSVVVFLMTLQELDIWNTCESLARMELALSVTETIALTHCCLNPIIYAFVGEKFRKHMSNVLFRIPLCAAHCQQRLIHSKVSENDTSNTTV
ncbi:C-C chemokine receptor type 4 [Megalops cyprinoides]|uniref:C-C chemokine receptor type 4 n=1 Tax=Megalops cyprinoides TaxID=118141 RepID=UPI00186493E1|nr:C-C chemokine receptor type 4 [Megalops cyprinoides]